MASKIWADKRSYAFWLNAEERSDTRLTLKETDFRDCRVTLVKTNYVMI